jgi:hypothetical protein
VCYAVLAGSVPRGLEEVRLMTVGDGLLYFKTAATVISVHKGGKRLGVLLDSGKTTFVNASNAKVVTA